MKVFIQNLNKFLLIALSITLITTNANLYADEKEIDAKESADAAEQKKDKKEFESIEEFIEDGEYKKIEGFMNILHETEKDKYYLHMEYD